MLCVPATSGELDDEQLQRPLFGMYGIDVARRGGIEYHLPHGDWIRLLREHGFEIEALLELQAPDGRGRRTCTTTTSRSTGRGKWPSEEIWVARKA